MIGQGQRDRYDMLNLCLIKPSVDAEGYYDSSINTLCSQSGGEKNE